MSHAATDHERTSLNPDVQVSPAEPDPQAPPRGGITSPAWELELLISGAIVVALFQLPGLIASVFGRFEPHATEGARLALALLHTYLLAAAYGMIVVFTLHLATRAYWVALIGLNSVYPRGIRWSHMTTGPVATRLYRDRLRGLPASIERLDNFCSIAFSFAFMLVAMIVYSVGMMAVLGGIAWVIAHFAFHGAHFQRVLLALFVLYVLPVTVLTRIDRQLAKTRPEGAPPPRWLERAMQMVLRVNPTLFVGSMQFTLSTNIGRKRFMSVLVGSLYLVLVVAFVDEMSRRDKLTVNAYDYFAMSPAHGVDYRYYESQRRPGDVFEHMPSIQSDVVTDRYLKLFVPFAPATDNAVFASKCPGIRALETRGPHMSSVATVSDSLAAPVLACATRLHAVTLDGSAVPDPGFAFYEQPVSATRGFLAYLDVSALTPGRHVLTVAPLPASPGDAAADSLRAATPYVIPFWR